jgi:hypothetical protein
MSLRTTCGPSETGIGAASSKVIQRIEGLFTRLLGTSGELSSTKRTFALAIAFSTLAAGRGP